MTSEEEIERIKKDFNEHWSRLENHPTVQHAIANKNPVMLGEIVGMIVHGNYGDAGVASQSRHKAMVSINHELKYFDSLESAQKFVAFKSSDPSVHIDFVAQKINGNWQSV